VPILRIADPDANFVVCTDACKEGLDGVMSQNRHTVCYESRKLMEHERLYVTHDLELETIVHALKMWQHYLMGKRFELRTNHCGPKYLFGKPSLNVRKIRWLDFLGEYDFDIKHIRGKENKMVDALSRRIHEMHATTISMYQTNLHDRILEVAKSDQHYMDISATLQQGMSQQNLEGYELREDQILMYRRRVYVSNDQELKNIILSEMHKVPYVGHLGYQKKIVAVKKQYFWPGMNQSFGFHCEMSRMSKGQG
jgi:hypothetical protein